jgi:hypothetical protein
MGNIFICYRREDSQLVTDRIFDHLAQHFPRKSLFKDVDNIPPGVDFRTYIENAVKESAVMLAVIGPDWVSAKDATGRRRLDNPTDFVNVELSSALELQRRIIPVLVRGARMPTTDELPPALKSLADINALPVRSDPDFTGDFARLRRALDAIVGRRYRNWIALLVATAVFAAVMGTAWYEVWRPSQIHRPIGPIQPNNGSPRPVTPPAGADDRLRATHAAEHILTLLDENRLNTLWDTMVSQFFKDRVDKNVFLASISGARVAAGGDRLSSQILEVTYWNQDPQTGFRGDIYVCRFLDKFPAGNSFETVVVIKEPDGQFRLGGAVSAPAPKE